MIQQKKEKHLIEIGLAIVIVFLPTWFVFACMTTEALFSAILALFMTFSAVLYACGEMRRGKMPERVQQVGEI